MTAPAGSAVTHPVWCDPRVCDAGQHADVRHSATPVVYRTAADDVEVTIALHRDDQPELGGRYRTAYYGISLDLRNVSGSAWAGGGQIRADAFLLPAEAEAIAHSLLTQVALARAAEGQVT